MLRRLQTKPFVSDDQKHYPGALPLLALDVFVVVSDRMNIYPLEDKTKEIETVVTEGGSIGRSSCFPSGGVRRPRGVRMWKCVIMGSG